MVTTSESMVVAMPDRPRHPKKDLEAVLVIAEKAGWRVTRKTRYFKMYCPCGNHLRSIHLSPSDPNYKKNAYNG